MAECLIGAVKTKRIDDWLKRAPKELRDLIDEITNWPVEKILGKIGAIVKSSEIQAKCNKAGCVDYILFANLQTSLAGYSIELGRQVVATGQCCSVEARTVCAECC